MLYFVENVKIVQKLFRISVYNLINCSKNTRASIVYSLRLCSLDYLLKYRKESVHGCKVA